MICDISGVASGLTVETNRLFLFRMIRNTRRDRNDRRMIVLRIKHDHNEPTVRTQPSAHLCVFVHAHERARLSGQDEADGEGKGVVRMCEYVFPSRGLQNQSHLQVHLQYVMLFCFVVLFLFVMLSCFILFLFLFNFI